MLSRQPKRFYHAAGGLVQEDRVNAADLQRLANQLLHPDQLALTLLGNLGTLKLERADLAC